MDDRAREAGIAAIRAVVADASQSLFTPALYRIEQIKVLESEPALRPAASLREVISYEGLFRDAADDGQAIEARGKLERVDGQYYRLVVGTTMLRGQEYVLPVSAVKG